MAVGKILLTIILVKSVWSASLHDSVPLWGNSYTVEGVLQLPYAELKEPFTAYYDATTNQSRIDYYGDLVVTMQLQAKNTSIKIAYMTTEAVLNKKSCFLVNGSSPIQSVLPDLTDFKKVGQDLIGSTMTDKWVKVMTHGKKKNTYTMWVDSKTSAPVRYEMMGYDTLLGSHYDKYYLDYSNFQNKTLNASVFDYTSFVWSTSLRDNVPLWGNSYTVEGVLQLPYAELKEPFTAYYDATTNQSRIDYYGDLVVTMQLQAKNTSIKIAYMTTELVLNKKSCFLVNGSSPIQSVLPDLTDFKKGGQDSIGSTMTDKWVMVMTHGKKKNTYTMWVDSETSAPVRYEMMGYDTLLGSHYDKYYLDYSKFQNKTPNASVFD